jgi:hypothetical protein
VGSRGGRVDGFVDGEATTLGRRRNGASICRRENVSNERSEEWSERKEKGKGKVKVGRKERW